MTNIALITTPLADSWNGHGGGWWMVPMMFGMALFWGAIVLGFIWFVRQGADRRAGSEETPLSILDRRFAEGAVSLDEYQQRRGVLSGRAADGHQGVGWRGSDV